MKIRPIHTDADHEAALKEIERLWDAKAGTEEYDRLDVLATLVEAYERKRWPISKPNPVQALLFRMDQLGLSRRELEPILGTRARVSEVLNGKRSLSLTMIRNLNSKLDIPAEVLIAKTGRVVKKASVAKKLGPQKYGPHRSAFAGKRAG
jgi:HTH-type transcriptional regulator / antitoxin HigA